MDNVKILDCTLRDGGYLIDSKFGNNTIKGIIKNLVDAKIDIIECGFLKNEGNQPDNTIFKYVREFKKVLPINRKESKFVALADISRYDIKNLDPYDRESLDGIRACFFKNELHEVFEFCKRIIDLGYEVYVQPVDIQGYNDNELLELIEMVNKINPYAFSIVDTFGSMYKDNLIRIFSLINHNLNKEICLGFHSHNNLQMSFALAQEFVSMSIGKRNVIIDSTLQGMGRGAGNTNTELIAQYMNTKYNSKYNMDIILDILDVYINNIMTKCKWGYSIPYFLAGVYNSHVNNIQYLNEKPSIKSKDMRYILNYLTSEERKHYDYDLLEKQYLKYFDSIVEDEKGFYSLKKSLQNKDILLLIPGHSIELEKEKIKLYINKNKPIVIGVNFIINSIKIDYVYFSNKQRYEFWKNDEIMGQHKKILTSNIKKNATGEEYIINLIKLIKCGMWKRFDNSAIMCLRLLNMLEVKSVNIAGFDGYDNNNNYSNEELEVPLIDINGINEELRDMLIDFKETKNKELEINFITNSRFESVFL